MQQIIYFFQKYKYFLFFVALEIIALNLIIRNHNFHKSKFISSTNNVTGWFLKKSSNISEYLSLKKENKLLAEENTRLKNLISKKDFFINEKLTENRIDSFLTGQKLLFTNAKIIDNNFSTPYNFITIDKGTKDGITQEMAVANNKGVIGVTENTGSRYTRVRSILNKNSRINARLKNSFHFGSLIWDGKNYNVVQLTDIPRQAIITKGDTIITGGKSTIFPEGIPIGTVIETPVNNSISNSIDIQLFNDMSNLGYAYVINNLHKNEIKNLENTTDD